MKSRVRWGLIQLNFFGFDSERGEVPLEGLEQQSDAIGFHSKQIRPGCWVEDRLGEQGPSETS